MNTDAPVLTAREYTADTGDWESPNGPAHDFPSHWYIVPDRKLRNDGVTKLVLYPAQIYQLTHDGTGWRVATEHETPHRYLTDNALQHTSTLPGTDAQITLNPGTEYEITQDSEFGPWRVRERATATL